MNTLAHAAAPHRLPPAEHPLHADDLPQRLAAPPAAVPAPPTPWWRVGMVWLVLSGPAIVVVAGLTTAAIAIRGADRVVTAPAAQAAETVAEQPAMRARNHAATPR